MLQRLLARTSLRPQLQGVRGFAAAKKSKGTTGATPAASSAPVTHIDVSLEGRYATAIFNASKPENKLDKVYEDLATLRDMGKQQQEFKIFLETPGIRKDEKMSVIDDITAKMSLDPLTSNLLKILVENKRLAQLGKIVETFEQFYRAEKGEVLCKVTSASELSQSDKSRVEAALSKRFGQGTKLILDYEVQPNTLGGLVVKSGEQVLDFSVASKLERMQATLLRPVE